MSKASSRVKVHGRSWKLKNKGVYCFEITVDGEASELRVAEDVAFDLLGAFTMSDEKCLEILRLHRSDLARNLDRKLYMAEGAARARFHFLSLGDIDRADPTIRDRERSERSETNKSPEEKD
jgi:hypothetical protein